MAAVVERTGQRSIYAYCHVRTNQVLYSFTPSINPTAVARQFPDTGANTSFVQSASKASATDSKRFNRERNLETRSGYHLRKDLWRPLWTLSIPEGENADAQGRHVFKKLREWRKLHETSWEPPALLSLNHSEEEIKKMQKELERRGGAKKNNVYDVIKHKKKKMRVAAVLDQRANSIADLAAVLAAQEALGTQTQENKDVEEKGRREYQVQSMIDLAKEAEAGGLQVIDARLAELREAQTNGYQAGEPTGLSKSQMKREMRELNARRTKMAWSASMVAKKTQEMNDKEGGSMNELTPEQQLQRLSISLPSFPTPRTTMTTPKRGSLRARLDRENRPVFSTEGIVVKWANQLDAEYAEAWPETIAHEPMGLSRHRAPHANQESILDVANFRAARIQANRERVQAKYDAKDRLQGRPTLSERELQDKDFIENRESILTMVDEAVAMRSRQLKNIMKRGETVAV